MLSHDIFICLNPWAVARRSELAGMFCADFQAVILFYFFFWYSHEFYHINTFDKEKKKKSEEL